MPTVRPRILFISPSLGMGGAERHTVLLRHKLAERGYPTSLISYGAAFSEGFSEELPEGSCEILGLRGMSDLPGWKKAFRAIEDARADVVFGVNQTPSIVACAARMLGYTNAKLACIFHTTELPGNEGSRLPLFRLAGALIDAMVYVGSTQRAYWAGRKLWCRHSEVIENGIDLSRFAFCSAPDGDERARLGIAPEDLVIGLVAQFRPEKNHILLVEALQAARDKGVPIKLLFVGDGPTYPAVTQRVSELGLNDHVIFAGLQRDVRPFIKTFDVGILCTSVESFSVAALEQLAMGVPMIITCHGGGAEVITSGESGWLVDPSRPNDIARVLLQVATEKNHAGMREAAREAAMQFNLETMIDRYERLIARLLSSAPVHDVSARSVPGEIRAP